MEFRTWTQGVTFCTRMDYLTPMFQETAYCLAIEKLLGITDQIPERASVIRVLMMELTRISSHLVAPRHRRHGDGRHDGDDRRLPRARAQSLRIFEDDHRPADEQRLHPPRRRGAGPARAARSTRSATWSRRAPPRPRASSSCCSTRTRSSRAAPSASATSTSPAAWRWASPARCCARPGCRTTCARPSPTAATRPTTSTSSPAPSCDAYGRLRIRIDEMYESLKIVEQAIDRLQRRGAGPVMVDDKKIAWPAQLAIGGDGMGNSLDHIREIMGTSMESLIHHFKLVTEGFRVPPGQAYAAVESPKGELGCHVVSDGGTRPYRAHFRDPSLQQPAGRGRDVRGRPGRRRHRRRGLDRPRHGRCRPLMPRLRPADRVRAPHRQPESKAPTPTTSGAAPRRRRRSRRPLPAEALGPAAAAAPRAVRRRLRHRPRHRLLRRAARPDRPPRSSASRPSTRSTSATPTASTPSGSAPTRCARSWAATRSGTPSATTSASATTRPPTTARITLERIECNAACDYAPVVMANWEFFDNQTPESHQRARRRPARRRGRSRPPAAPTRSCTFKEVSRVLAGLRRRPAPTRASAPGRPRWSACGWPTSRAGPPATATPPRSPDAGTRAGAGTRVHRRRPPTTPTSTAGTTSAKATSTADGRRR